MAKTRTKTEPKPRKRKADDPEQYERFRQAARELGTDESEEAFERAFKKMSQRRLRARHLYHWCKRFKEQSHILEYYHCIVQSVCSLGMHNLVSPCHLYRVE